MGGAAGEDHGDVRLRHVHAFVKDVRGDDGPVATLPEAVQDLLALAGRCLVGDTGDEKPLRERVDLLHALGEHDGSVVPVLFKEALERRALALGGGPDLTPLSRRQERLSSPRVTRGGYHDEPLPVLRSPYNETVLLQEIPVHCVGLGVLDPLDRSELDGDADDVVGRKISAGQIFRRAPVYDGTDELGQELVPAVGTFGGGGEAQSIGGEEHLRDHGVLLGRQVVDLVVDYEREAVAVAFGVNVRRVVGRNGERRDLVVAAAEQPDRDRGAKGVREYGVPLLEQRERGHDDERAASDALDGAHRHGRLPGAGRQDHDAAQRLPAPGGEGLL